MPSARGRGRAPCGSSSRNFGGSPGQRSRAILAALPVARVHLHDLVENGGVDRATLGTLLAAMQRESRVVKPTALGVVGEATITAWLERQPGGATSVTYTKTVGTDDDSGRPFVLETAFATREDGGRFRLVTGINWAPTLADPFRALDPYGLSLKGLLGQLHLGGADPVTFVVHLACPHLNYTDRGRACENRGSPHPGRDEGHEGLDKIPGAPHPLVRAGDVAAAAGEEGHHQRRRLAGDA